MAWQVDYAHSHLQFSVKHMMITWVRGQFPKYTVEGEFNEEQPERSTLVHHSEWGHAVKPMARARVPRAA